MYGKDLCRVIGFFLIIVITGCPKDLSKSKPIHF